MDTNATTHATLLVRLRDGADLAAWQGTQATLTARDVIATLPLAFRDLTVT